MSMRDVTGKATDLMKACYGDDKYYTRQWELLGQRHEIPLPEWIVLDAAGKDGITIPTVKYEDRGIKPSGDIGKVFVLERDTGKTKLFFVWVPPDVMARRKSAEPINYHILFHAHPHSSEYSVNYWDGIYEDPKDKSKKTPSFVLLGTRYLFYDFRSLGQHLMARNAPRDALALVVPVASIGSGYFGDLQSPAELVSACREIGDFIRGAATTDASIGKVMLTGYSYSGHVIEGLVNNTSGKPEHRAFYESKLSQVTLMDIHLSDNAQERIAKFRALWNSLYRVKEKLNRELVLRVYTAYRDHADHVRNYRGDDAGPIIDRDIAVNMDDSTVTGKEPKQARGEAKQFYSGDLTLSLLHFPTSYFSWYVDETRNPRGFDPGGGQHGHGWLLRVFLSHALFQRKVLTMDRTKKRHEFPMKH